MDKICFVREAKYGQFCRSLTEHLLVCDSSRSSSSSSNSSNSSSSSTVKYLTPIKGADTLRAVLHVETTAPRGRHYGDYQ